jgi:DNA modification methylase
MKTLPDKCVDLCLTDPPYGIGISSNPVRQKHAKKDWDSSIPIDDIFKEIFRISKNQVIWGGNYFDLPKSQGFLIWDKKQPEAFSLAMCEYAYSSIQSPAKMFRYSVLKERGKQHPTQKPVKLGEWILEKYAKEGDIIFDPFLGSGTFAVASQNLGFDYIGCELDKDYFEIAQERLGYVKQRLF